MNLNAIANSAITSINPNIPAILKSNAGITVDETGKRVSNYTEDEVTIQAQSLSSKDLEIFSSLLQQGQMLNVYVTGQFHVLRRISAQGADKLIFTAFGENSPSEWLIKQVTESFPDWCKVLVWRQS